MIRGLALAAGLAVTLSAAVGDATPPAALSPLIVEAKEAFGRGDYRGARRAAESLLNSGNHRAVALSYLGWSEYYLGNYAKAQDAFRRLASIAPGLAEADLGLGWSAFRLGRFADAEQRFRVLVQTPKASERISALDGLGWIAFFQGRYGEAGALFSAESDVRATASFPHDRDLGRGWIALIGGNVAAARAQFAAGLSAQRGNFRLHDGMARAALLSGDPLASMNHALAGLGLAPADRGLFYLLDAALVEAAGRADPVEVYGGLTKRFPYVVNFHNGLGHHARLAGKLRIAETAFSVALQLRPRDPFALNGLAATHAQMYAASGEAWRLYEAGDYLGALAGFTAKIADAGENPAIEAGRGWSLLALGRFEEARQSFAAALKASPTFALAREGMAALKQPHKFALLKGWDLLAAGHMAAAQSQFRRVGRLLPEGERWQIDEAEAWLLLLTGKDDDAAAGFRRILERQPRAYLSYGGLGQLALRRGEFSEAVALLERSYALNSRQIVANYAGPARSLLEAGQPELALRIANSGISVHPSDASLSVVLAQVHRSLGNTGEARRYAGAAAKLNPAALDPHLDAVASLEPGFASVYAELAWGLYFAGSNERALARFRDYAAAGGNAAAALRGAGFAHYRLARYLQAAALLSLAANLETGLPPVSEIVPIPGTDRYWPITYDARSTLAWAQLKLGRFAEAERSFRAVLKYAPFSHDALTGLGYALIEQGKVADAIRPLHLALVMSPGHPDAWQALRLARQRQPDLTSLPGSATPKH